ncbi:Hypothetical protein CINCED_3A025722, partial [Cinara cedri]
TVRDGSPAQPHKQNNSTTLDNVSFFKTRKTIIKTERSISLRESHSTLNRNLQSYSPQNATTRSLPFEESRSMLPQESPRGIENDLSSSFKKTVTRVDKARSPSP